MKTWSISESKEIGGEAMPIPIMSFESLEAALAQFERCVEAAIAELDAPFMRDIGGRTELYLEACDNILGIGGDVIRSVAIKRPLHSPHAMVCDL